MTLPLAGGTTPIVTAMRVVPVAGRDCMLLNLCGALVLLGLTSARLTIWILALMPVVIVPLIVIGRRVRGLSRSARETVIFETPASAARSSIVIGRAACRPSSAIRQFASPRFPPVIWAASSVPCEQKLTPESLTSIP